MRVPYTEKAVGPRPALQPSPDPVELDLGLHQGFLEPFQEISPEPCCTCPGSAIFGTDMVCPP